MFGSQKAKSKDKKYTKPLSKDERNNDDKIRDILLANVRVTDFQSMFEKSMIIKKNLKPQSLLNYKQNSETTRLAKQILHDKQNKFHLKELERQAKEKERVMKERMKRLTYLYRK